MPRDVGVDGCPGGWLAAWRSAPGEPEAKVFPTIDAVVFALAPQTLAVDMPIGLSDSGDRLCDRTARAILGNRASSVFPAPPRPLLRAQTWEEANSLGRELNGKGVSRQGFSLFEKVRALDDLLQRRPELRAMIWEVHPEVSFAALHGEPIAEKKRTREGKEIRLAALQRYFDGEAIARIRNEVTRAEAGDDDILDALICLWTAERISLGIAITLPPLVPLDSTGVPMRIVY
jgi:predicted RNase H-like nuclease